MEKKISDKELMEFIIDEHSSDSYSFLELQKKVAKLIIESPAYKKDWMERYKEFLKEFEAYQNTIQ